MPNERLRSTIASAGLSVARVAQAVGVDPKTVDRWINRDRLPHRAHRQAAADLLKTEETYLWPNLLDRSRMNSPCPAEFVAFYPHRGSVPSGLWLGLLEQSQDAIDILVYAGLFLMDGTPDIADKIGSKAEQGVRVRMLLGDPASEAVATRGSEEGVFGGVAARIQLSLTHLQPAIKQPGVQIHLHDTNLYNSIFRFDDVMLVNTHVYGAPAARSPVIHLRRAPGRSLFDHYMTSFGKIWESSVPVTSIIPAS
jgi:transcriptional regulator with XRE-family HTH domain